MATSLAQPRMTLHHNTHKPHATSPSMDQCSACDVMLHSTSSLAYGSVVAYSCFLYVLWICTPYTHKLICGYVLHYPYVWLCGRTSMISSMLVFASMDTYLRSCHSGYTSRDSSLKFVKNLKRQLEALNLKSNFQGNLKFNLKCNLTCKLRLFIKDVCFLVRAPLG